MNKIKSKMGLLLIAFICAYTVDGISQSEKSSSKKEVVIIKKMIDDDGNETVEKKVFTGDDLSEDELQELIEAETGSDVDVNIWTSDEGEEMEISIDDTGNMLFMEDEKLEEFLQEKGLSMDDIAEMNINVDQELIDGKEISQRTISIVDNKGNKHEFELEEDMGMQELHEIKIMSDHKPRLGVMIAENADGVLVEEVIDNSPAQKAGLQNGDIIYAIGESNVKSVQDLLDALKSSDETNLISYRRDGKAKIATVEFSDFKYEGAVKKKIRKKMVVKKEEK